jgi:hypothetical protein
MLVEITKLPLCSSDFLLANLCNFGPEKSDFDLCKDFRKEKISGIFQLKKNKFKLPDFDNMFQQVAKNTENA